jgi:hypothetical protein
VQSKVEAKPNNAILPKLRCGSVSSAREIRIEGAHSYNLLQVERSHLATVNIRAGPFCIKHCELIEVWA